MAKSPSRLHQTIKNWIVLKSTEGLLKNAQDGTSRCFGGREINKPKVGTILWDNLQYIAYMEKFHLESWHLLKIVPETYL